MKFIPTTYALKEGTTVPEGAVTITCSKCGQQFAVPSNEVEGIENICEACADTTTVSETTTPGSVEAAETIAKALGN